VVPKAGRLLIVDEPAPFQGNHPSVKKGSIYQIHLNHERYVCLLDKDMQTHYVGPATKFLRPSKQQLVEHHKSITRFSFGKGSGQFGNDPEVFVVDANNTVIPAYIFLPSKENAKIEPWKPGADISGMTAAEKAKHARKVFWDGFQAEFTSPVHSCFGYGCDYVRHGLCSVLREARKFDPAAKLTWQSVIEVPQDLMAAGPPDGVALGCSPSKNAYEEGVNPRLIGLEPTELGIRFAGFHIHIGIPSKSEEAYKGIIKTLDAIVGVASVSLFEGMEDPRRRLYYGLAGEYRTPSHGLEWRVLSSCVMCHPAVYHLLSDMTRASAALYAAKLGYMWNAEEKRVRDVINNLDVEEARKILKENEHVLRCLLRGPYIEATTAKALDAIHNGIRNLLSLDMHANWKVDGHWQDHSDNLSVSWSNTPLIKQ
jgi:hypothetical protein